MSVNSAKLPNSAPPYSDDEIAKIRADVKTTNEVYDGSSVGPCLRKQSRDARWLATYDALRESKRSKDSPTLDDEPSDEDREWLMGYGLPVRNLIGAFDGRGREIQRLRGIQPALGDTRIAKVREYLDRLDASGKFVHQDNIVSTIREIIA